MAVTCCKLVPSTPLDAVKVSLVAPIMSKKYINNYVFTGWLVYFFHDNSTKLAL